MVPLSFVMLTVRIVDFILRLDFTDILKVAAQQEKKNRLGLVNMLLLLYYLVIFLVSTFVTYFPELHLEGRFRLPLVVGYRYFVSLNLVCICLCLFFIQTKNHNKTDVLFFVDVFSLFDFFGVYFQ